MYCPNCGKELQNESTKFCPECGQKIHLTSNITDSPELKDAPSNKPPTVNLRKAMFTICILFIVVIVCILIAAAIYEDYSYGIYDWVYGYGGMYVLIGMGIIAVICGVIGFFAKNERSS